MVDHAAATDLLDRYTRARRTYDGDAWVELFAKHAELHPDPFEPPLVGHNALRAYLLDAARSEDQGDFVIERHWVSGATILAAWHGSHVAPDRARVRLAGFLTLELGDDGRIERARMWWHRRRATGQEESTIHGG